MKRCGDHVCALDRGSVSGRTLGRRDTAWDGPRCPVPGPMDLLTDELVIM